MVLDVGPIRQRKQEFRQRAEAARQQLADRDALSRRITARLAALPEYRSACAVMFYVNLPHEADTQHFLPAAWQAGKQVVVPYMAEGRIHLFRLESLDELLPGHFLVPEPRPELRGRAGRQVDPASLELVVVPGVAFDRRGVRVGHGKGYYDLFLKHVRPHTPRIALSFECQLLDDLPMLPHDVWMTKIVTEAAVYEGLGGRGPGDDGPHAAAKVTDVPVPNMLKTMMRMAWAGTLLWLAGSALGQTAAGPASDRSHGLANPGLAAIATSDRLAQAVDQLPEDTAQSKLKKAALAWAIEDARAAIEAGLNTAAKDLLADVQAHLDQPLGRRVAPPKELLPPIPGFGDNPYVRGVLQRAESVLKSRTLYKKGDEGYRQIDNAWTFASMGNSVYAGAWGLCYPQSPYAADPKLLVRVLRLMQAIFQNHREGDFNPDRQAHYGKDPNINRFCFVPTLEAYLLLAATYPDLLLPSKRAEWLASARVAAEYQVKTYGIRANDPPPACYYANMDVYYMLMLELAARIFQSERYHAEAQRFCQLTADMLYPDGAFSYHGFQNECFTYHQIDVALLARYWQLTGSALARETVVKSRPYYPHNVEPGGVPEYYTDSFWKHYWRDLSPIGPEIVAGMTGCPQNRRVAKDELRWETPNDFMALYAAALYRPDLKDEPLPDGYLVYDRNVEGPRGRFGRWSFAGTTRFGAGCQGKDTFVGGMLVDEPTRRYPLNAALQVVTSQYRLQPRKPETGNCQRWRECRYLSQDEHNTVTIARDFAAMTTRYRIQNVAWGGKSTPTDWAGNQQWILTPQRLLGVLEIEPLSDQKAYSIHGRIRFGLEKEIERVESGLFKYGALRCRLHEHNYADVITEASETFYLDKPDKFRSTEIVLRDQASIAGDEQTLLTYAQGTRQFFTVEVWPDGCSPAESVRRVVTAEGLRGLEVCAAGQYLLLAHNPTDAPIALETSLPWAQGRLWLHTGGSHTASPKPLDVPAGRVRLEVPSHSHVVLEKRSAAE